MVGMRVTHCLPIFSELTQTFIYELVGYLQRHPDLDIRVLTWNRKNIQERPFEPVEIVSRPGRGETLYLRTLRLLPEFIEDRLPASGFERRVQNALIASKSELVHAQFGPTAVLVGRACRRAGVPLIVTYRGRDASAKLRKWRWRRLYQRTLAHAAAITCVSPELCERIRPLLPASTDVVFVPGGKQSQGLEFRPPPPPRGRLISVGRLIEKKGHGDAIRALGLAVEQGVDAELTIVGDGPLKPSLEEQVAEAGLQDRVHMTGPLPFQEVIQRMQAADFLIAANRTGANGDCEGIPNVVKEAQILGLPVIGTRHGGIPDALPDMARDELVDEGDVEALADRIKGMQSEDIRALHERARAGHEFILDRFSPEAEVQAYAELYARILGRTLSQDGEPR